MKTRKLTILTMVAWGFVFVVSAIVFISLFLSRGSSMGNFAVRPFGHGNRGDFVVVKEEEFYYMNSINLDWVDGNVTFIPTDGYAVRVVQKANKNIDKDELFTSSTFYSVKNEFHEDNSLTIRDSRANKKFVPFFNWKVINYATDIEIYLPKQVYKKIVINSVSSNIDFTDINATKVNIENVSGNISGDIAANAVNFNTVSGDVDLYINRTQNGNTKIDTESISGKIILDFDSMPIEIKTNSVSGDVRLTLPENNFTANLDSVSGDIRLDNVSDSKGNKNYITVGEGDCEINAESISGDLSVSIK